MSKPAAQQKPPVSGGRRAQTRRRHRKYLFFGGSLAVILALIGALIGLHVSAQTAKAGSSAPYITVGKLAPNDRFNTLAGKTETIAALRGKPTLIWFVTTWCSSCQAGTQAMAQNIKTLASYGVRVIEVENYNDLGQSGPAMPTFAKDLAQSEFSNPDWIFGNASSSLTYTYNPKAYLDIYYLINAKGKITYVNSSPGSTMPQLLSAAKKLA